MSHFHLYPPPQPAHLGEWLPWMITEEWEGDQAPLGTKVNQGTKDPFHLTILTPFHSSRASRALEVFLDFR